MAEEENMRVKKRSTKAEVDTKATPRAAEVLVRRLLDAGARIQGAIDSANAQVMMLGAASTILRETIGGPPALAWKRIGGLGRSFRELGSHVADTADHAYSYFGEEDKELREKAMELAKALRKLGDSYDDLLDDD